MRKVLQILVSLWIVLLCSQVSLAQSKAVSGVVVDDADNSPMRDVTVTVKGTSVATKTNEAGYYTINAAPGQVLTFTFVDYGRIERTVGSDSKINVRMVQSSHDLENVVVTAYGAKKNKRELAYMAQDVKGAEIAQTQRDNWINALAGRVAGANITPTSGTPGASSMIILRGGTSLSQSNQPLFVVDGVPYDNQTINQESLASGSVGFANRNTDYTNRGADLNSEDIESVTILKGPEASALYGSDGANGAIVITTKKGKSGRATLAYDNSFRFEKVYKFPEIQTVYRRGTAGIANDNAVVNPYSSGNVYSYFGPKYAAGTQLYDNIHAFFRTGFTQKHNVSVDGGSEVATYRLSLNYKDQTGIVPNTSFTSLSARLTGTAKVSPKVNLVTTLAYTNSLNNKSSKGAGGYLLNLLNFPSDIDVRNYQNLDGSRLLYRSTSTSLTAEFDNPFWDVYKNLMSDKTDRITTNLRINANPFKWLSLSNTTNMDFYNTNGSFVMHPQSRYGFTSNGFISIYEQTTRNLSNVSTGTITKKIGAISNSLTLGFSFDDNKTRIEGQKGERFFERDFISINNTEPTTRDAKTTITNDRKARFFGNYAVNYKNIYYLSFAGSYEANSKLMSRTIYKDPYYGFGSVSASIVFSDLKIFDKVNNFDLGKLRISYGTTGKAPSKPYIIDNAFVSQITTGGGYAYGVTGNNFDLKPEFTKNLEYGAELKFFKNRLGLDITRYELSTVDQIIVPRYSYGSGYVLKWLNGGEVRNKGIEAVLTATPIKKKNFSWDFIANFDRNRGKVISMANLPAYYDSDTWVFGNLRSQAFVGASIGNLGGYSILRNTAGDVIISSTSGLPLSNNDFISSGDRQPDFKIGFTNNFTYKNISLSFNLDFRRGGDVFNANELFLYLTGLSKRTLDREIPVTIKGVLNDGMQNTTTPTWSSITVYPYYRSDYYSTTAVTESDFIEKVNWMRLRDATISYKLPKSIVQKQKVFKSATIFVTGTDLFMITNYTGADPSVNANTAAGAGYGGAGIDYGSLATPKGINFGCKIQF